jgi:hypothetical protein
VTKICESVSDGFAQGGRNLDRPQRPVQGVLLIQKSGELAQLYGRFMGGSDRNMTIWVALDNLCNLCNWCNAA